MAFLERHLAWNNDEGVFWVRPKHRLYSAAKAAYEEEERREIDHQAKLLARFGADSCVFIVKNRWLALLKERLDVAQFLYKQSLTFYRRNWNCFYHAHLLNSLYRQRRELPVELWALIWSFLKASF